MRLVMALVMACWCDVSGLSESTKTASQPIITEPTIDERHRLTADDVASPSVSLMQTTTATDVRPAAGQMVNWSAWQPPVSMYNYDNTAYDNAPNSQRLQTEIAAQWRDNASATKGQSTLIVLKFDRGLSRIVHTDLSFIG